MKIELDGNKMIDTSEAAALPPERITVGAESVAYLLHNEDSAVATT